MTIKKTQEDISNFSFEQALAELEEIVSELESGEAGLDKAMEFYLRGQSLKEHCSKKLASAKMQVEKINSESEGAISLSPFDTSQ